MHPSLIPTAAAIYSAGLVVRQEVPNRWRSGEQTHIRDAIQAAVELIHECEKVSKIEPYWPDDDAPQAPEPPKIISAAR